MRFGPKWVSTIYASINEYKVLLELEPKYQSDPHALVAAVLQILQRPADSARHAGQHQAGSRTAVDQSLSACCRRSRSRSTSSRAIALGDVVSQVQAIADQTLPPSASPFSAQGAAKAFESSLGNLWLLLVVAILVVYIVLGILYESYIHPLTILSGLAVGRLRRADHAVPVPHGPEHLRVCRPDHADRHREKERHHADRFRAGRRAQPGPDAA